MGARTMYSRAHQVVPAHLVRMVEIRAGAHQHVRSFVLSSARFMQAQVEPEEVSFSSSFTHHLFLTFIGLNILEFLYLYLVRPYSNFRRG
jgi:hypothetical protein